MRAWALLAMVTLTALSGCTDEAPAPIVTESDDPFSAIGENGLRDLRTDLQRDDDLPAPDWEVGDWFGHHLFFNGGPDQGTHINTIVVEDLGSELMLATDNQDVANWEAAWDFPMLGPISKSDVATTAFGADWNIYDFPMRDGKTWTSSIDPLFNGPRDVTFTATYMEKIDTPYGVRPGFDIMGHNEDGAMEIQTNYVPEIGWYSYLNLFNTATEDSEDTIFKVIAMGRGENWTGTYFIDEAKQLIAFGGGMGVNQDDPAATTQSTPPHHESFTMADSSTRLYGILGGGAVSGESRFLLIDPAGGYQDEYKAEHHAGPGEPAQFFEFVDQPTQAGDWELGWAGYGLAAWGFVLLFEITETQHIM